MLRLVEEFKVLPQIEFDSIKDNKEAILMLLEQYKEFLLTYSTLSDEEKQRIDQQIDMDKLKATVDELELMFNTLDDKKNASNLDESKPTTAAPKPAPTPAPEKLPQTDGASQTGMVAVGLLLVAGALFFLRRRQTDVK